MSHYLKKSIERVDVKGKRVFLRADLNVPLGEKTQGGRQITNDGRIRASLPTIQYILEKGGSIVLTSHLGRPKGQANPELSLKSVAQRLGELLGKPVKFAPDCIGPEVESMAKALQPGEVLLLENVRFHPEEEKNDPQFSKKLAALAEMYCSDAFGSVHRAHSSTVGVAQILKPAVAGLLIAKELKYLGDSLDNPQRPVLAVLGGAKVGSKIGVIQNLMKKVDTLFIAGGMIYTFFKIMGYEIGTSLFDDESVDAAKKVMDEAKAKGIHLMFPHDCVIADKFDAKANWKEVDATAIPPGWMGMDIGPKTINEFTRETHKAKTIIWNGPVGVFEMPSFAKGTEAVAQALAHSHAITIIGGGETAAAVEQFGLSEKMTHISTGGGASLEFMEGRELPGIAVLDEA